MPALLFLLSAILILSINIVRVRAEPALHCYLFIRKSVPKHAFYQIIELIKPPFEIMFWINSGNGSA